MIYNANVTSVREKTKGYTRNYVTETVLHIKKFLIKKKFKHIKL